MSESGEALPVSVEREPHLRGASAEDLLGIPKLETPTHMGGQPMGTHVSRAPHHEPSVTFVSSGKKTVGSKERNILGSAGHGLLRFLAAPPGAVLFSVGMLIDAGLAIGISAGGTLTGPLAVLAGVATTSIIAGIALLDFATGRKKKFVF
ncbi:MAG: hypothetical protein WC880_02100 [Candidatus Paceibacterota bacterium]